MISMSIDYDAETVTDPELQCSDLVFPQITPVYAAELGFHGKFWRSKKSDKKQTGVNRRSDSDFLGLCRQSQRRSLCTPM